MAFVRIEDLTGTIDAIAFSSTYARCHDMLDEIRPLKIYGALEITDGDEEKIIKLRIGKIDAIDLNLEQYKETIRVSVPIIRAKDLAGLLTKYSGGVHTVYVTMLLQDGTRIKSPKAFGIRNAKNAFMQEISSLTNE